MENLLKKFNIFDLFTMLIPGVIIFNFILYFIIIRIL